jgi:hypothetical protein
MTTASASGAPRVTSTGSPRSEPRAEVLGNSSDQTPASHAECLQRDRGFGALHLARSEPGIALPRQGGVSDRIRLAELDRSPSCWKMGYPSERGSHKMWGLRFGADELAYEARRMA